MQRARPAENRVCATTIEVYTRDVMSM